MILSPEQPMATNLFTKTRSSTPNFHIYDAFPASASKFAAAYPQATQSTSLSELAAKCDVVITMLPGPAQVKEVYLGKGGLLEGAKKGQLFVDSSTIDAGTVVEVSKVFESKGALVIDAPVSGGWC
jgi:3-hydroxyisobutyrate dehydrogenase-like beta-hydroxyacid dehydrogenase